MPFSGTGGGGGGAGLVKRFVMWDASSGVPVIQKASGVSSLTDNGTGDVTVVFDSPEADATYGTLISGRGQTFQTFNGMENHDFVQRTTAGVRFWTLDADSAWSPMDAKVATVAILNT
jgi:hypothetical protein